MIARGDLGIECPMEELPIIQRPDRETVYSARQTGHRRDSDARVDDHESPADPGRNYRRGECRFRAGGCNHAQW